MGKSRSISWEAMRWARGRSPLCTNRVSAGSSHTLPAPPEKGALSMRSCMKTQKGGTMSSLKFSYWSSPKMITASGLKSSIASRALRKLATMRSWWSWASASSLAYSSRIGSGQFSGFFLSAESSGLWRTRRRMFA